MNKLISRSLLLLAMCGGAASAPPAMSAAQESNFEEAVAGRTAGPAQSCVTQRTLGGNKGYDGGVIVFEGPSKSTVYVNKPPAGCAALTKSRTLRTQSSGPQLCRGDNVTIFDRASGIDYGDCTLGEFVPYRR